MNHKFAVMHLSLVACLVLASAGFSADKPTTRATSKIPSMTAKPPMAREWVTFEVRGAESAEAARLLSNTLETQGLRASIRESQGKPYRLAVDIDRSLDLGAIGKAVMSANTPQKAQSAPSLDLVFFAPFTNETAQKAAQKLASIQGVDARNSHVDVRKGELCVRLAGGHPVTADEIHNALRGTGINVRFTKQTMAHHNG